MQAETGCKINVSPASGQDFEREIGLVGLRDSIEQAKQAIMEKVHAVVSPISPAFPAYLTLYSKRRTIAQVVDVAMTINIISKRFLRVTSSLLVNEVHKLKRNLQRATQIRMLHMVAMRTMSRFGTLVKCNSSKLSKTPKVPQPRNVISTFLMLYVNRNVNA